MTARSAMMVTLHDTRFVECRWWNDGWTEFRHERWVYNDVQVQIPVTRTRKRRAQAFRIKASKQASEPPPLCVTFVPARSTRPALYVTVGCGWYRGAPRQGIIIIIIIIIMGDLYSAFHSTRRFTKISIHSWRNVFKETSFKHSK